MRYARIEGGFVREIGNFTDAPVFHPSIKWVSLEGRDDVAVGWAFEEEDEVNVFSPPVVALSDAVRAKSMQIAAAFAACQAAGYTPTDGPGAGKAFQIDDASQMRLGLMGSKAGLVVAGVAGATWWEDGLKFVAADNSEPVFTAAEFVPFADAVSIKIAAMRLRYRSLKNELAIAAATGNAETVNAIEHAAGWP